MSTKTPSGIRDPVGTAISSEGRPPVSVVLPAFNEEEAVGPQVQAVSDALTKHEISHEIIVVDDASDDGTEGRALESGARVLKHAENRGYGAAIKTGILAASSTVIVIIDADGSYPAEAIPELLSLIETADMAVGARTGKDVHIPRLRRPAKWVLRWLAGRITGRPIPDLNSGLRCFRRECVEQYFPILPNKFSFTTTITLALLGDGYRVVYAPIDYHPRIGKSKIRPWHFMDFLVLVIRIAMLFQPLKVFVPIALGMGALGALKVAFDLVALVPRHETIGWSLLFEAVLSSSALLLLLVAAQVLLVGMVADGVLRRISQRSEPLARSRAVQELQSAGSEGQKRSPVDLAAIDKT